MFDVPSWAHWLAFGLSLSGISAIFVLSAIAALRDEFQFFPPPNKQSWQHKTFLGLFRLYLYPLIVLTLLVFEPLEGTRAWAQYGVGSLLLLIGFGMAIRITLYMGWRNAFGEKLGLMTTGWFAWSRNPIYVFTWVGLIGWAMIANHGLVSLLLIAWALMYIIAPFFKEPWLEAEYGKTYCNYKQVVRRFI